MCGVGHLLVLIDRGTALAPHFMGVSLWVASGDSEVTKHSPTWLTFKAGFDIGGRVSWERHILLTAVAAL